MALPPSPANLPHIPEILRIICEHLISEKKSLAALARTCRIFEGPALDMLWFSLDDFYQLAKCLPSNVLREETKDDKITYLVLKHYLLLSDCSRLLHYAKRVRHFTFVNLGRMSPKQVHITVFQGLQVALQGNKLLPNVRHLTWRCKNLNISPYLHMFLGPYLSKIQYTFSPRSPVQLSLVPALCEQYHSLKAVEFLFDDDNASTKSKSQAAELISMFIYKWNSLEYLTVPNATYSALLKLSQLPHLKSLIINQCKFDNVPPTTSKDGFPFLAYLELQQCHAASDCIAVVTLMDCSPLHDMRIAIIEVETSSSWEKIFLSINQHCCHDTLQNIHCWDGSGQDMIPSSARTDMIKYEDIRPLLVFQNIRIINAGFCRGLYLSNPSSIKEMATCWKSIEILIFEHSRSFRGGKSSDISLLDLLPIVEHCSELQMLGLPFHANSLPKLDKNNIPWDNVCATNLTRLFVGNSPIINPALVAATLSAIFPSLEDISTILDDLNDSDGELVQNPIVQTMHKAWKQTEELVKMFSIVRTQERSYTRSH
ncbi:hypothetical protein BDQ17DRAFT_1542235 [Cyathus striatus]|nr:hypothetical protein BDQ17DRAFT_1542235 [Cyathus striatus]